MRNNGIFIERLDQERAERVMNVPANRTNFEDELEFRASNECGTRSSCFRRGIALTSRTGSINPPVEAAVDLGNGVFMERLDHELAEQDRRDEILPTYRVVAPTVCATSEKVGGTERCANQAIRAEPLGLQ